MDDLGNAARRRKARKVKTLSVTAAVVAVAIVGVLFVMALGSDEGDGPPSASDQPTVASTSQLLPLATAAPAEPGSGAAAQHRAMNGDACTPLRKVPFDSPLDEYRPAAATADGRSGTCRGVGYSFPAIPYVEVSYFLHQDNGPRSAATRARNEFEEDLEIARGLGTVEEVPGIGERAFMRIDKSDPAGGLVHLEVVDSNMSVKLDVLVRGETNDGNLAHGMRVATAYLDAAKE